MTVVDLMSPPSPARSGLVHGGRAVWTLLLGAVLVGGLLAGGVAVADDQPGQPLLDEAVSLKLDARTPDQLARVVTLCEQAIEKGLDEDAKSFAVDLATGALYQQAEFLTQKAIGSIASPDGQTARREAMDLLQKSIGLRKEQYDAHLLLARLAVLPTRRGDRSAATIRSTGQGAANEAVRLAGSDGKKMSEALVLRATLAGETDATGRLADLNQAVNQDPSNAMARMLRAEVLLSQEDNDAALADLRAVLESDNDNVGALQRALQILLSQEKFEEAGKLIDAYLAKHEDAEELRQIKAQLLMEQDKNEEALAEIEKLLAKDESNERAIATKVDILRKLGRAKEALTAFEKLTGGGRMNDQVRLAYSDLLIEAEEYQKAKTELDRVLRRNADMPEALFARSRANLGLKKFDDAVLDLKSAIDQLGEDPALLTQLAFYYEASERPRQAIEAFTNAIGLLSEGEASDARSRLHGEALRGRGDAKLSIGDHASAIQDYEEALTLIPESDGVLNNLAWVLATTPKDDVRDGSKSLEYAKKAVEVSEGKKAHVLSTLAAAYAETGDFEKAREWSGKAVALAEKDKDDSEMLDHLRDELKHYEENKPFREIKQTEEKPELTPGKPKQDDRFEF